MKKKSVDYGKDIPKAELWTNWCNDFMRNHVEHCLPDSVLKLQENAKFFGTDNR